MRWVIGIVVMAALGLAGFIAYGSWHTATTVERMLTAGAPTAQGGEGWPAPERPHDIGYTGDPQAAYGYAFETLNVPTENGPAPAWLVRPPDGSNGETWAIFVHGIGGRRENGYRFVPTLRRAGLPVLMISYRNDEGAPAAPDRLHAFGLTEWRDLDAAVSSAMGGGAARIVLVGESMGGGIIGQFLRRSDQADRVAAIVLDAPALDFPAVLKTTLLQLGVPFAGLLVRSGLILSDLRLPVPYSQAVVLPAYAAFEGPLFLSHGAADRLVPVISSDQLAAARAGRITYLRTEADHILSWKESPERYEKALADFLATLP